MPFITVLLVGERGRRLSGVETALGCPATFGVVRVTTAEDAIDALCRFVFDVVIAVGTRAHLFDMVIRIREGAPKAPIMVLPHTEADHEFLDRVHELGARGCISPTASSADLREAVLASCG
jgi:DNA-binding NarL/FixJ family response regulator